MFSAERCVARRLRRHVGIVASPRGSTSNSTSVRAFFFRVMECQAAEFLRGIIVMTHARTLAGFAPFIIPLLLGGCVVKTEVNHSAQGCGPDAISCDDGLACTADVCLAPDELVDSYRCANTVLATACVIDSACHVADNCGVCDADLSNDCVADCAGDWGG